MSLQNRVDPWGNLIAVNSRGAWLGNRGILHNQHKEIVTPWKHKAWITCQLAFKDRRRQIFNAGHYSELFFLDEATAFSAGHRPCAECRRARYLEFKEIWRKVNSKETLPVAQIDKQMHAERAVPGGNKVTYTMKFESLPSGAFIERSGVAYIYWQGSLKKWSPEGYSETSFSPAPGDVITVLTPFSIVQMYANNFEPQVHESANN